MQFTDLFFLFVFLPPLLVIYYLIRQDEIRKVVLVMFSLIFYACGAPQYVVLICVSIVVNIFFSSLICKIRGYKNIHKIINFVLHILLGISLLWNVSILVYYKYWGFIIANIGGNTPLGIQNTNVMVPLGLSFYTFRAISLVVDCYRGDVNGQSILNMTVYLSFFPHIISGPISRFGYFNDSPCLDSSYVTDGVARFIIGVSKKVLIADMLCNITTEVFSESMLSTSLCWLGAICYSLQLYFDFSSYSDMAIGITNMLGYKCDENFNYPYMTKTVGEFWRRWHISLGAWFRDYIYIPIGGSRSGNLRMTIGLLVVWLFTGIWHGAGLNYILWGLLFFAVIYAEKMFFLKKKVQNRVLKYIYRILVLIFIVFQWILFRFTDITKAAGFIKEMIVWDNNEYATARAMFLFKDYFAVIIIAILLSTPVIHFVGDKIKQYNKRVYDLLSGTAIVLLFFVALAFVFNGHNNPFIYTVF